uniref:Hepcidin antimicrobial peptide n=1 Tax=Molossus molossus TaxID=27622 RepID=A0A7J8C7K9_MOLMO|nr:hepcidin antimicrobial peptide [Molossus molossus]
MRIQAACLLLLLLASLASASVLHQPGLQRLRRDTHFPICIFCCGCCYPNRCGICCKT